MSKIDYVFFDFDGTIAKTDKGIKHCVNDALNYYGMIEEDQSRLDYFIGPPLIDAFMHLYGVDEEKGKMLVDKYRESYRAGGMFECEIYEGMEDVIRKLRSEGRKAAIVSSKPGKFVGAIAEKFGIRDLFDFISAPPVGHVNPPKSRLIQDALSFFNASPDRAVMIGDRHFDVTGGREAGTLTIGVTYGYGSEEELRTNGADYIAHSPYEISELIENYEKRN